MASRPTPYTIALAALLVLQSSSPEDLYGVDIDIEGITETHDKVAFLLQESLQQEEIRVEVNVKALLHKVKVIDERIAERFTGWLKVATESVDSFVDFMTTIVTAPGPSIDAESRAGIFLRRLSLGWEELSFERNVVLFQEFCNQVNQQPEFDREGSSADEKTKPWNAAWPPSAQQLDTTLRHQLFRSHDSTAFADDEELRKLISQYPELPSAQFISFLQCLKTGERAGALDALHKYMDYSMINYSPEAGGGEEQDKINVSVLPFAAILSAVLYQQSGDDALMHAAIEEAVRIAQQSQDPAAVAFSMGWLASFDHYKHCIQRAAVGGATGKLRSLTAGANLSIARDSCQKHNIESAWLAWNDALAEAATPEAPNAYDRATHISPDALYIQAQQRLVAAGLWDAMGETGMSMAALQTTMISSVDHLSESNIDLIIRNIAKQMLCGSLMEEQSNAATSCAYGRAILASCELRKEFKLPPASFLDTALLVHEWSVFRGEYNDAERILMAMQSHLCPRLENYGQVYLDVMWQKCFLLSRRKRFDEAKFIVRELINHYKEDDINHVWLLIRLTLLHLDSDPKGFVEAIRSIIECLILISNKARDGERAIALSLIAQIHFRMGNAQQAVAVIKGVLPTLMQQHVWFRGEAYLLLAKCHLSDKRTLQAGIAALKQSEKHFRSCQDCLRLRQVYQLLALAYHKIKRPVQRDEAAQNFVQMTRQVTNSVNRRVLDACSDPKRLETLALRPIPVVAVL